MKTVIITGSRDHTNKELIWKTLDELNPTHIVHGNAKGADKIAENWAKKNCIPYTRVPADWDTLGPAAGPIRNIKMLMMFPEGIVCGFPLEGSVGTWHCIDSSVERDMETKVVYDKDH